MLITEKIKEISEYFAKTFQKDNSMLCPRIKQTKLLNPFTTNEIKSAIKKQKNNKSAGCDQIRSEHLRNAPHALIQEITNLLNNTTETGNYPKELKIGHLTPIQKPGKPKGPPENLRPIILL